jgi:hypothetical protein
MADSGREIEGLEMESTDCSDWLSRYILEEAKLFIYLLNWRAIALGKYINTISTQMLFQELSNA